MDDPFAHSFSGLKFQKELVFCQQITGFVFAVSTTRDHDKMTLENANKKENNTFLA